MDEYETALRKLAELKMPWPPRARDSSPEQREALGYMGSEVPTPETMPYFWKVRRFYAGWLTCFVAYLQTITEHVERMGDSAGDVTPPLIDLETGTRRVSYDEALPHIVAAWKALGISEEATQIDFIQSWARAQEAVGWLTAYAIDPSTWERYRCDSCGAHGVKLWREYGDDAKRRCAACLRPEGGVDELGRCEITYGGRTDGGRTDQVDGWLPFVPTPDGGTWGYTSVPGSALLWWRTLPTRAL